MFRLIRPDKALQERIKLRTRDVCGRVHRRFVRIGLNRWWGGGIARIVDQPIAELLLVLHQIRDELGRVVIAAGGDAVTDFADFVDGGIRCCQAHDGLRAIPGE